MKPTRHYSCLKAAVLATALSVPGCGESDEETAVPGDTTVVATTSGTSTTPEATTVTLASINAAVVATLTSVQAGDNGFLRGGGNQGGAAAPADNPSGDPYCTTSGGPISVNSSNNTASNNSVRYISTSNNVYPAGHAYCLFSTKSKVNTSIFSSYSDGAVLMCLLGTITFDGSSASKTLAYSSDFKTCLGDEYDAANDGQIWVIAYKATKIGNPLEIPATAGFDHKIEMTLSINGTSVLTTNLGYKSRSDSILLGQFSQSQGTTSGESSLFSIDPANGVLRYELYQPTITYTGNIAYTTHIRSKIDGTWDLTKGFTAITGFGLLSSTTYDYNESLKNVTPDPQNPRLAVWSSARSIVGDFKTGLVSRNYLATCNHGSACDLTKLTAYNDLTGITGFCVIPTNTYKCPGIAGVPLVSDADLEFVTFGASPTSAKDWFGTIAAPLTFKDIPTTATPK